MKQININIIRLDGNTQARVSLDEQVVDSYAELMKEGTEFPPIVVFHDGSDYWLADGFHRYFALKKNNSSLVSVEVHHGTRKDAKWFGYGANGKKGKGWEKQDLRKIMAEIIEDADYKDKTNAEIARHIGISKMHVGRLMADLKPENAEEPAVKVVTRKDGTQYEVDVSKLSNQEKKQPVRAERPVGTKPDSSTIDETKLENQMLTDKISEFSDTIMALTDENTLLRDKIAIGQWDASEIEKMDIEDTVKELREQIRLLEIDNKSLREGRDTYQNRVNELIRANKSLQNRLRKYEDA